MISLLAKAGLQLVLLLLVAPLLSGIIKTLKARLQTRRGPNVLQSYRDIFKLLRKGMIIPETASWIFSATPYIVFVTAALVGLMIPMTTTEAPLSLFGGVLAVVYLLALGRFFLALGGLDTGSSFGGLGSSHGGLGSKFHKPERNGQGRREPKLEVSGTLADAGICGAVHRADCRNRAHPG